MSIVKRFFARKTGLAIGFLPDRQTVRSKK